MATNQIERFGLKCSVLSQVLGSYLYLYIWEKNEDFFLCIWENLHKIGKNMAIFGLGMPPVTGGKSSQIKSLK